MLFYLFKVFIVNYLELKRLEFGFFSLLVSISITLFVRCPKWAKNAELGGYLSVVI